MPIYRQILSADITNVLIVVVRYFGGTKLGIPGLIRSYGSAAEMALGEGETVIKEKTFTARVKGPIGEEHMVFVNVSKLGGNVEVVEMSTTFDLLCILPLKNLSEFKTVCQLWHKFEVDIEE